MLTTLLPPGSTVLLSGVVGSTAYDLAGPTSDQDRLGVFQADPRTLWGLQPPAESVVVHEPDVTLHELRKLLALALRCNPTVTELLWLDDYETRTPAGEELLSLRSALLSEPLVRSAYLGYATAQFTKATRRERSGDPGPRQAKHLRHMFRLLDQGIELLSTGHLSIRVRDRAWYLDVLPTLGPDEVTDRFDTVAAAFTSARSVLPEHPDVARVEDFLVRTRMAAVRDAG